MGRSFSEILHWESGFLMCLSFPLLAAWIHLGGKMRTLVEFLSWALSILCHACNVKCAALGWNVFQYLHALYNFKIICQWKVNYWALHVYCIIWLSKDQGITRYYMLPLSFPQAFGSCIPPPSTAHVFAVSRSLETSMNTEALWKLGESILLYHYGI